MLADIGCGSGLSCRALQASGAAWVGTDITREMLQLAAADGGCTGRLARADFGQGLPLRPGCLDGAISISAVQWLCSSGGEGQAGPPPAMLRFFQALHACLAPGAAAALQVYPHGGGGSGGAFLPGPSLPCRALHVSCQLEMPACSWLLPQMMSRRSSWWRARCRAAWRRGCTSPSRMRPRPRSESGAGHAPLPATWQLDATMCALTTACQPDQSTPLVCAIPGCICWRAVLWGHRAPLARPPTCRSTAAAWHGPSRAAAC